MKKSIRVVLAVAIVACGLAGTGVLAADQKTKEPEIPGSATMTPKIKEGARPPKPRKFGQQVKLGVWIRADGLVDQVELISDQDNWSEACIQAAKKIKFEPVLWEGRALAARTEVIYTYDPLGVNMMMSPLPNLPGEVHTEEEFGLTKPLIEQDPELILPLMSRSNGQRIEAALEYVINEQGLTDRIQILGATSEGALRSALDMVGQRKYQPAKVREQPVVMQYRQVLGLQSLGKRLPCLQGAVDVVDPAYPYERFLAQEEGNATVRFKLNATGTVTSTELVEASHPDFGGALVAAVESWKFSESAAAEQPVREYRHDFEQAYTPYAARRLIDLVREQKTISKSGAGLDAKPKLLARPALAYPTALFFEKIAGSANVEFVIDRVGLAQVPRVVSATRPEFGWAAATLVNGMRFEPLTRGGKPAELRVEIPVSFTPPKPAEPTATP